MGIYCPNDGIVLEEWNHDIDHVHDVFEHSEKQNSVNLSMLIKVPAVGC